MHDAEIEPGVGLGKIHFGMTASEVEAIMGRADDAVLYDEGNDRSLDLSYERGIFFSFRQSENFRLLAIEVGRPFPCRLFGAKIDSITLENVDEIFLAAGIPRQTVDVASTTREESLEVIIRSYDDLGMLVYFGLDGHLQDVNWGVLFDSEDKVIWPSLGK